MKISGFVKNSLVDYPGKICTTVFTAGCNMNCWYCHNYHLLSGKQDNYYKEVMKFLTSRKGFIEAVTITGGEPTLNKELESFIKEVRNLGYLIKLDTNGLNPDILEHLISKNLLDYVAMDIKAPFDKYEKVVQVKVDLNKIKKSIDILKNSNINYEFRTTFSPDLTLKDLESIGHIVKDAKNFSLQNYRRANNTNGNVIYMPHKPSVVNKGYDVIKKYVSSAKLKGL